MSGFDCWRNAIKSQRLQFVIVHWTGDCVQNQHLDFFSTDLAFLHWTISRKLSSFVGSYHITRGDPLDPKSGHFQGAWLPAPSPRRRRSLRTPRVLWLGLVQLVMSEALSVFSGIWHGNDEFVWVCLLWSGKTAVDWRPGKEKKKLFDRQQGRVPMVPLACSCPIAGIYELHISGFASTDAIFIVTSVLGWIGWDCSTWRYSESSFLFGPWSTPACPNHQPLVGFRM